MPVTDPQLKHPCVYIMASHYKGTLFSGVTSNLVGRVWQHKTGANDGFTSQYGVHLLVWYEPHETMESAIAREKALKKWRREWKISLIEGMNPQWLDLYEDVA